MTKPIIAIMYDFDKTLSTTDMQNYSFIPKLGLTPDEFWNKTAEFSKEHGVEKILSYMYIMIDECKKKGIPLTEKFLNECGKDIVFNPGVLSWFDRINNFAESIGFTVEHYLVSSGTLEIVKGCPIYKKFTKTYGCQFVYDDTGVAVWPQYAINYTQKTQFVFRIAKGATDISDDTKVNEKQKELRIPLENIIYVGDGLTDIACMTVVKNGGGTSIAVFQDEDNSSFAKKLKEDGRVNFAVKTDYSEFSAMENAVKLTINKIKLKMDLEQFEKEN